MQVISNYELRIKSLHDELATGKVGHAGTLKFLFT